MDYSKSRLGWLGLSLFVIGITLPISSEWIPTLMHPPVDGVLLASAPFLWLLGLGCGIASRSQRSGRIAIWTNGVPLVLLALWFVWIQFFPIRFG